MVGCWLVLGWLLVVGWLLAQYCCAKADIIIFLSNIKVLLIVVKEVKKIKVSLIGNIIQRNRFK